MDGLSFWLTTASLLALVYATGQWVYGAYIRPAQEANRAAQAPKSVKRLGNVPRFKRRSKGSNVHERSERSNEGSTHQEAKEPAVNVQNVQAPTAPAAAAPAPPVSSSEGFTLSPVELVQLSEALNLYREGSTVEQAVCKAFQVTKGGSEGYKRAKSIFDAATVAPGAAPAGTYAAVGVPRAVRPARRRARSAS